MVSDFEMNSNNEKPDYYSVVISSTEIIKMALTGAKRNDGTASALWCTETDDNQMRPGLKAVQVRRLHLTVVWQHLRAPAPAKAQPRHRSRHASYHSPKAVIL